METKKKFTQEEKELFNQMFDIQIERFTYSDGLLGDYDLIESPPHTSEYSSAQVLITLISEQQIEFCNEESDDPKAEALNAFRKFLELNRDEEKFTQYLLMETNFNPI